MSTMGPNAWHRPGDCDSGACIEARIVPDATGRREDTLIHLRRSTGGLPASPTIAFTRAEWRAFVAAVKAGEYDVG